MKDELERITEVMAEVLQRYRNETPPGNSPSMICHEADDILALYAAWNRRATPEPDSDLVEIAYEAARPHFHYAKKGTPDAHSFDRTQPAILLRKALPAIIAAIEPHIAAAAREDERAAVVAWLRTGMVPDHSDEGGCPADKFAAAIERGEHRENGDG